MLSKALSIITITLLLTACGGSSSSSGPAENREFYGSWTTACTFEINEGFYFKQVVSFSGNNYSESLYAYNTSDCTGVSETAYLEGDISYYGDYATATCMSEKYDVTNMTLEVNGQALVAPQIYKGLVCIYKDRLFTGSGTNNINTRPTTMNTEAPYYKI